MLLNFFGANITLVIFIGIIAGLANLIPLVGPFVGMVPALLIAFMNNLGNDAATSHMFLGTIPSPFFSIDIIFMFLIVQQIEGNLITPALVGGASGSLISNTIAYHMKSSLDWAFASALGTMLLVGVLTIYWIYNKLVGIDNIKLG